MIALVLVKLNRPVGTYQWGSQSAAPTFQRVAQRLLNYYNIAPDEYRVAYQPTPTALPTEAATGLPPTPTSTPPPEPTPVFQ